MKSENIETKKATKHSKYISILLILVVITGACIVGVLKGYLEARNSSPTVITNISVTDFIENDQLNTFKTNYEGVVTVFDEKKNKKVDYYVSYLATVDAGVNFEEIDIQQNDRKKEVNIFIPKATIQDINIEITSLEFLFYDKKQNDEDIINEAYKICNKDAENKLRNKEKIIELATENVKNIINAYIQPFMDVTNNQYRINFIVGDQNEDN